VAKAKKLRHKIWRVKIASRDDGPACVFKLPVRATYLIESRFKNGCATIEKKAMALAAEDGINNPIVSSAEWINAPEHLRGHVNSLDDADWWKE
jgi:hypothetical protein